MGSHLSINFASPSSTIYLTRYSPPLAFNFAPVSQKSIIIGSASASLYSPLGRLYVNKGLAESTSPAVLAGKSLPSRGAVVAGLLLLLAIVLPLFVVVGFAASPPPLTVNVTI